VESPTEEQATRGEEECKGDGEPAPLESIWQLLHDPAHHNPRIEAAFKALRDLSDSELAAVLKMGLQGTTAARNPNNGALLVALDQLVDALLLSDENLELDRAARQISLGEPPRGPAIQSPASDLPKRARSAREAAVGKMADSAIGRNAKEHGTIAALLRQIGAHVWELENREDLRAMHVTKKAELLIERIGELRGGRAPEIDLETVIGILEKSVTLERKTARLAVVAAVVPGYKGSDFSVVFEQARKALKTLPF
jgi:hypothetical protein